MFTKWRKDILATGLHKMTASGAGGHRTDKLLMEFISRWLTAPGKNTRSNRSTD